MTQKQITMPMEQIMPLIRLQLDTGGKAPLQVTGSSMYPMLRNRKDSVMLEPAGEVLQKGDLILYRRDNGAYVLHRIVKTSDGKELTCSGDNQFEPEAVHARQVIAKVTAFTRKGKTHQVTDRGYRLYVWLWTGMFSVRKPILALRRRLGRLRRSLCRKR